MRQVSISEVCTLTETCDPRKDPDVMFHYVDIASVDNKLKKITSAKKLLGKDAPSRARKRIRQGDIILSTTRPNLNAVAIVPEELDGQVCSTGFCVLRPREIIERDFLFFHCLSEPFVGALTDLVKGALYPAVSDKQVFSQIIPLPDLATQRRIAARLRAQLAEVEAARKAAQDQLDAIDRLPAAYLLEAFGSDAFEKMKGTSA